MIWLALFFSYQIIVQDLHGIPCGKPLSMWVAIDSTATTWMRTDQTISIPCGVYAIRLMEQ